MTQPIAPKAPVSPRPEPVTASVGGFDLQTYAREHGYRLRNLHDGGPVPPTRRQPRATSAAHRGAADRHDAIIGRDGFVDFAGWPADRVGWCAFCRSTRQLTHRLRALDAAGAVVVQCGESEAAGHAPVDRLAEVLAILRPWRRPNNLVYARARGGLTAKRERGAAHPTRNTAESESSPVHFTFRQELHQDAAAAAARATARQTRPGRRAPNPEFL